MSKVRKTADGSLYGGTPIARGALYLMLQNKVYRGEIVHKDQTYRGEHEAIVDKGLWDKVQAVLAGQRVERQNGTTAREPSLLTGLIVDAEGHRMSPAHANKKGVRYRYYVSSHLQDGSTEGNRGQGQRIPALSLERLIVRRLCQQLDDAEFVVGCVSSDRSIDVVAQKRLIEHARRMAQASDDLRSADVRSLTAAMLVRAQVHLDRIELTLSRDRLARWLRGDQAGETQRAAAAADTETRPITLSIPARLKRAGKEMRMVVDDGSDPPIPDTSLVRLLVRAHVIRERLINDRSLTLEEIAKSENVVPSYATRLYRLTLLAPDIVGAILAGKHPPELTARRLMDDTRLPLAWHEQRRQLGFDAVQ